MNNFGQMLSVPTAVEIHVNCGRGRPYNKVAHCVYTKEKSIILSYRSVALAAVFDGTFLSFKFGNSASTEGASAPITKKKNMKNNGLLVRH